MKGPLYYATVVEKPPDTHSGRDPSGRDRARVTHGTPHRYDSNFDRDETGNTVTRAELEKNAGERERGARNEDGFSSRMPFNRRTCGY
jgi:hypothetical protein